MGDTLGERIAPALPVQTDGFSAAESLRAANTDAAIPELTPRKPGPGLPLAFALVLLFFAVQFMVIFGIAAVVIVGFVILQGKAGVKTGQEFLQAPTVLLGLSSVSVLITVLAITAVALRTRFGRALALRLPTLTHVVLVCLLAPPLYLLVLQVAVWAMAIMPDFGILKELEESVKTAPYWLVLLAGAVLPGISEEILCRGFLGRGLVARWGPVVGVLFASIIFGLIHIEPVQICYAAFIGVILHVVYLSSKSLLAPMLLHALNNAIAFAPTALAEAAPQLSATMDRWEKDGGMPLVALISAVATVATLLTLFSQTQVRWYRDDGSPWDPGYVTAEKPPSVIRAKARAAWPKWWAVLLAAVAYAAFLIVVVTQFDLLPSL